MNMDKITLPKTIVHKLEFDYFIMGAITDDSSKKTVKANVWTPLGNLEIILWASNEYDQIGDWTQAQAVSKISDSIVQLYFK